MLNLVRRFTNFFQGLTGQKGAAEFPLAETKSEGAYAGLWARAKEAALFGNKVTQPYSQIPTVYKAIKAIADNVPQAELIVKDWETEKEIYPRELLDLFARPNPLMTYNVFIQYVVGFLSLYGETFIIQIPSVGQVAGTGRNLPAELWTFCPKKMQPVVHEGILQGWRHDQSREIFPASQVIHIKDFNPYSDFRGMSPTASIDKIMDIDFLSLVYDKAFFENNATMGFMLSTDGTLTEIQRTRLKEWLDKKHAGANQAFKTAILEAGLKPQTVGVSHTDMDFIEQKRFTREEMLGIWRVPKALFNITEDLNYATFVGQMKIFWQYAIMPALMKIADGLNVGLVTPFNPQMFCVFDPSNVPAFQEDFKEKVVVAKDLFAMGFTGNEVNEKLQLGFEPKPWRDKWWIPISTVPSEVAEDVALAPPEPSPTDEPATDEPAKTVKPVRVKAADKSPETEIDMRAKMSWKVFLSKQILVETRMRGALKSHFFQQRVRVLKSIQQAPSLDAWTIQNYDLIKENEALLKKTRRYLHASVKDGENFARSVAGDIKPSDEIGFEQRVSSLVSDRKEKIKRINTTVKNELAARHAEILRAGGTLKDFSDAVKAVYNLAEGRTLTQARTETSAAMNAATHLYYEEIKVTHKKWVTAGDEVVRDSHKKIEGEVTRMDAKFSNGLDFPAGDGPAEEVINCRCTAYPIFRKDGIN